MKYTNGYHEVDAFQFEPKDSLIPDWFIDLIVHNQASMTWDKLGRRFITLFPTDDLVMVGHWDWITKDTIGKVRKVAGSIFSKAYYPIGSEPITDSERLAFLHSTNVDSEGFEYGVAKVKRNEHGQIITTLWTNSDHSDIDKLILERRKALVRPKIPEDFKVPEGYKLVPINSDGDEMAEHPSTGIVCSSCGASPLLEPCQGNPDYCAMKSTPVVNRSILNSKGFCMKLAKMEEDTGDLNTNIGPVFSPEMKENLFGTSELVDQALKLCSELSKLPMTEDRARVLSLVADATFALQQLQETGNYHWPKPEHSSAVGDPSVLCYVPADDLLGLLPRHAYETLHLNSRRVSGRLEFPIYGVQAYSHRA